jgi:DNA invertase Pin-like site-specific DNA recombinase
MTGAKRCAIYTRKSTEEGLDQAFNSLDAQREACEAYIASQRHEGWRLVKTRFDDGGLSGGNMDRPALQALLAEIDAGRVDVIVVYKVDRLTRSLADFAKLVDRFDAKDVSFVSVTQQFNTSSSMGRLTLNVLLSFAQFEREVTAERIRDKIASSKRKGMWMGGNPPLGYDNVDKQLVVNEREATTVRRLFDAYLEHGCVRRVIEIAQAESLTTKKRSNGSGGNPLTRGPLYCILTNPIYAGFVRYGKEFHDGVHEAIIDKRTWDAVQAQLKAAAQRNGATTSKRHPLTGKLFADGERLTPTHSKKDGRRYRYYITKHTEAGDAVKKSRWRVPADALETAIIQALENWLQSPGSSRELLNDGAAAQEHDRLRQHLDRLIESESHLTPRERVFAWSRRILRIDLDETGASIELAPDQLFDDAEELNLKESVTIRSKIGIGPRGQGLRLVYGKVKQQRTPSERIHNLLARAHGWREQWFAEPQKTLAEIVNDANTSTTEISRELRLAFLAPDVVTAILNGDISMTAKQLRRLHDLPASWTEQRRLFGVASPQTRQ